jgi:hypothetical protein
MGMRRAQQAPKILSPILRIVALAPVFFAGPHYPEIGVSSRKDGRMSIPRRSVILTIAAAVLNASVALAANPFQLLFSRGSQTSSQQQTQSSTTKGYNGSRSATGPTVAGKGFAGARPATGPTVSGKAYNPTKTRFWQ